MKLFSGADNTFCNESKCKLKETCVRYIEHYGDIIKNHPRLAMLIIEDADNCDCYIK